MVSRKKLFFGKNKIEGAPILKLAMVKEMGQGQKKIYRRIKICQKKSSTKIRQQKFVNKFVKKICQKNSQQTCSRTQKSEIPDLVL